MNIETTTTINTFQDVVTFMESFTNLEKQTDHYTTRIYRLDRMQKLLVHFDHPEKNFLSIHIAGSKGKGSTATLIASALQSQGHVTGLYTSPHLIDYRERFTLAGTFFPDEFLITTGKMMRSKLADFRFSDELGETNPTTFELYTLYAFLLFSQWGCEYAVVETGLGGRLDATNTLTPIASLICPIELEHTQILGNTINAIATEKSMIIKEGIPSFISTQMQEARDVMIERAQSVHSPQYRLSSLLLDLESTTTRLGEMAIYRWKKTPLTEKWGLAEAKWHGMDVYQEQVTLKLHGKVMAANCALALMCLRGLGLYTEGSKLAMEQCVLPGRFQLIGKDPALYIDGAHTNHSLRSLLESMQELYKPENTVIIFGAVQGKDHQHMANLILHRYTKVILCRPGTFKKSDINALFTLFQQKANDQKYTLLLRPEADDALAEAKKLCPPQGAILVCGSFYLAGAIAEAAKKEEKPCH